jgi:hypothetical protein
MKKFIVTILFILSVAPFSVIASEAWSSVEEIEANGQVVQKNIFVTENIMKMDNIGANGRIETVIDMKSDKITIINHKTNSFQEFQLSQYISFAEQLASDIRSQGYIDPEKVIPKLSFEKKGNAKTEEWNSEEWLVSVDGKPYTKVWIAPDMKNSPILKFKKKFAGLLPDSVAKYRSVDAKIEDHFADKGMIVKMEKIPQNKKMPVVTHTVKNIKPVSIETIKFNIPEGYRNTSAPAANDTETK